MFIENYNSIACMQTLESRERERESIDNVDGSKKKEG
jgi:hypothetical protein